MSKLELSGAVYLHNDQIIVQEDKFPVSSFLKRKLRDDIMSSGKGFLVISNKAAKRVINALYPRFKVSSELMAKTYSFKKEIVLSDQEVADLESRYNYHRLPIDGKVSAQRQGIKLHLKHNSINAMEPGLGKSFQAIVASDILMQNGYISATVIVCKNTLKDNWEQEIIKTLGYPEQSPMIQIVEKDPMLMAKVRAKKNRFIHPTKVPSMKYLIISQEVLYDEIEYLMDVLKRKRYMLIGDESHWYRNPNTRITKAFRKLSKSASRSVELTGTLYAKSLEDIYMQTRAIGIPLFPNNHEAFMSRYFDEDKERSRPLRKVYSSPKDGSVKHIANVISPRVIRISKRTALELPTPIFKEHRISGIQGWISPDDIATIAAIMPEIRRISMKKIPYLIKMLPNILAESKNNKVIIWTTFLDTADELYRLCSQIPVNTILITSKSKGDTLSLVDRFNNSNEPTVAIITTKTGREGLNMTSTDTSIVLDRTYDLIDIVQLSSRIDRIGQDLPPKIISIIASGTIDEAIDRSLSLKGMTADSVYDSLEFKDTRADLGSIIDSMKKVLKE